MSRTYSYRVDITAHSEGVADTARLQLLLDLHMQDLLEDVTIAEALKETEAITVEVTRVS